MPDPNNTPTQALPAPEVGDIVTGIVTFAGSTGLILDVDGTSGFVYESELPSADGETSSERYVVGDQVEALILWIDPDDGRFSLSLRRISPGYQEAYTAFNIGDIVTGTIIDANPAGLDIDLNGVSGWVPDSELPLADGEMPSDRYAVGDQIETLVGFFDLREYSLILSAQRINPAYEEAFAAFDLGDIVTGTIIDVTPAGLDMDLNGISGRVPDSELPLADGEMPWDRYAVGDQIEVLVYILNFVHRSLIVSVRRTDPGYEEALAKFNVGDIVTGTVTDIAPASLSLDVNDVRGWILDSDLPLANDETPSDLYTIGNRVRAFVLSIDPVVRHLWLSIRRASPGYKEAFATFDAGDIVTCTITGIDRSGLDLDVNGVDGTALKSDLPLVAGEMPSDRYAIGDRVAAFIKLADSEDCSLMLSVRRASSSYEESLATFNVGDIITGIITDVDHGGLDLDVNGVSGWVPDLDLPLGAGETPSDRYAIGDQIEAFVRLVDFKDRSLILSVHSISSGDLP